VSGTEHAQFRQYDSTVGLWMSPDPYLGSYNFANPQSLNRYAYVLNNPLAFRDPSGLDLCLVLSGGGYSVTDGNGQTYDSGSDPINIICTGDSTIGGGVSGGGGTPSDSLYNFLASCEGYSSTPYNDTRKNCTIGYGHLLHLGPCTSADMGTTASQPAAMAQFKSDISSSVTALNNDLSVPLSQSQFDTMVSLTFNMEWRDYKPTMFGAMFRRVI
jgi:RHS repeat-associated protein